MTSPVIAAGMVAAFTFGIAAPDLCHRLRLWLVRHRRERVVVLDRLPVGYKPPTSIINQIRRDPSPKPRNRNAA